MSQVTAFRDKRPVVAKPYAPGGCPVHVGKQKCGETQGLEIIMDFHRMYQEKMNEIDVSAGGDSLQEKVDLQEQWISDLTEQNKLLARVIQELESETIGKIHQMEAKLNNSVKALGEEEEKALKSNENKIEEPREDLKVMPEVQEILEKMSTENVRLKQEMEERRRILTEEIDILRGEIYRLQEKNVEVLKETSIKDDIIKELRRELKKSKQKISSSRKDSEKSKRETAEKGVWVREAQFQTITHSSIPQESGNSAVIIIHRRDDENVKETKSKFDSSDSSECCLNENAYEGDRVQTCRSENDIKPINWMRPTRERSILTKIRKEANEDQRSDHNHGHERSPKRLNIPRHIPVKTYVNNIEYNQELE